MSLLQPNKVQSIFFLLQFRVRSVAICLPFFLSIYTCHLFLSARLFHLSSSTVLRHSCDNRGNPITSWSILKQIACPRRGHMDWCLGVPRLFLPPPPLPVMLCLALPSEGSQGELKKNTKLWIQFNLVSAMKNNLQARRGGSGNADMFQSIFSD